MASLTYPRYGRKQIKMTAAEEMMEGSEGTGLLDLIEFAYVYNQAETAAKNKERKLGVSNMVRAAQGITVDDSQETINSVLDYLEDMVEKDEVGYGDAAKAISLDVRGTLERREGIDNAANDMQDSRNALRELEKRAKMTGEYLPSESLKILDNLEDSYLKNERYLDTQGGLKSRYNALFKEASDLHDMLSLLDQADAIKYIEDQVTGLAEGAGLQLPEGTEGMPIEFGGQEVTRGDVSRYAQQQFEARNFVAAKKALNKLSIDMSAKGMKMAREVRAAGPLIDQAVKTIREATKGGHLPESLQALPDMQGFFNSMAINNVTSPEQIEQVFDILSKYIYEAADIEELLGGPKSVHELDEYLDKYQQKLVNEDLDDYQKIIVGNLINARRILAKAYEETYGKQLIVSKDAELEDILKTIQIK